MVENRAGVPSFGYYPSSLGSGVVADDLYSCRAYLYFANKSFLLQQNAYIELAQPAYYAACLQSSVSTTQFVERTVAVYFVCSVEHTSSTQIRPHVVALSDPRSIRWVTARASCVRVFGFTSQRFHSIYLFE